MKNDGILREEEDERGRRQEREKTREEEDRRERRQKNNGFPSILPMEIKGSRTSHHPGSHW